MGILLLWSFRAFQALLPPRSYMSPTTVLRISSRVFVFFIPEVPRAWEPRGWTQLCCPASPPPHCFLAFVQSRALTPRPFPWVFSAAGLKPVRNVVLTQSCWWVSASSPAAQGQTGTLLPPSGMTCSLPVPVPTLLSYGRFRRGRSRGEEGCSWWVSVR